MTKRGKILRDTNSGPGLVAVDGQHFQFALEGVWRGEAPPTPGMSVQVEFAPDASITGMAPVSDAQIAKEQAEAVMGVAKEKGKVIATAAVAKFGLPTLIATALLIIGWFFLSAVSVQTLLGKVDFTFWQVLGFLNSGSAFEAVMEGRNGPSAGFYGFLGLVALAGPYLPYIWRDKRAAAGGVLPLLFMLMAGIMLRSSMNNALGGDVSGPLGDLARQAREETMKAVSLGFGSYLSGLVSLYFAGGAGKKFLLARALNTEQPERSKQAAA
jgi:hypothetical protein